MSMAFDPVDRHGYRHHRLHRDYEPESRETYFQPEPELIRRPATEGSDLSAEEVQREFPPATRAVVKDRYTRLRVRSLERDYPYAYPEYGDPQGSTVYVEERRSRRDKHEKPPRLSLSEHKSLGAAAAGAILGASGKELWDHRKGHHTKDPSHMGTVAAGLVGAVAGYEAAEYYNKEQEKKSGHCTKSRSMSRDRSGTGLPDLGEVIGVGALAAGGNAIYNHVRSRSRDARNRDYRYSQDEYSRSPSHGSHGGGRSSKSVGDYVTKGLAALGIGEAGRGGHRRDTAEEGYRGDSGDERSSQPGTRGQEARDRSPRSVSSLSVSSDEEMRRLKKTRGKEFLMAGLATVATIHAADVIYENIEKGRKRHKAVQEGKLSTEKARRLHAKALMHDAVSAGLATLGIKGAFSGWKAMKTQREEYHNLKKRHSVNREKRQRRQSKNARTNSRSHSVPNIQDVGRPTSDPGTFPY